MTYTTLQIHEVKLKMGVYPHFLEQDPSRVKKILPFTGQLDLPSDTGAGDDDVDEMIQKLDMAMQVCTYPPSPSRVSPVGGVCADHVRAYCRKACSIPHLRCLSLFFTVLFLYRFFQILEGEKSVSSSCSMLACCLGKMIHCWERADERRDGKRPASRATLRVEDLV